MAIVWNFSIAGVAAQIETKIHKITVKPATTMIMPQKPKNTLHYSPISYFGTFLF
jgi:hypothetical protein